MTEERPLERIVAGTEVVGSRTMCGVRTCMWYVRVNVRVCV